MLYTLFINILCKILQLVIMAIFEKLCTAWYRVEMGACGFHLHPWHAWHMVRHSHGTKIAQILPWN
jgi:hypothetical protein